MIAHQVTHDFLRTAYPRDVWPAPLLVQLWQGKPGKRPAITTTIPLNEPDDWDGVPHHRLAQALDIGAEATITGAFTPAQEQPRKKAAPSHLGCLWAVRPWVSPEELLETARTCPLRPTMALQAGGMGILLWRLARVYEEDDAKRALVRVTAWARGQAPDTAGRFPLPGYGADVVEVWSSSEYTLDDVLAAPLQLAELKVDGEWAARHIVRGEMFHEMDRGESDLQIAKALLGGGHAEREVRDIFENPAHACGTKARERGARYLDEIMDAAATALNRKREVRVWDDGQVVWRAGPIRGRGWVEQPISNFCLAPLRRVELLETGAQLLHTEMRFRRERATAMLDASATFDWRAAIRSFGLVGPAWTGSSEDWQRYLIGKNTDVLPREQATAVVGWHGRAFVLPDRTWFGQAVRFAPYAVTPPRFEIADHPDPEAFMRDVIHHARVMREAVNAPIICWLLAAAHAPAVREASRGQFPLLVLEGGGGSGKTTTMELGLGRVFGVLPESERSFAGTVPTLRRSMQGTNATPVFIDEYEHRKGDWKTPLVNELLRLSFAAETAPVMDKATGEANEMRLVSPAAVATSVAIEDQPLRERCYFIRVPKLPPREKGAVLPEDASLAWWEAQPHGGLLRWWLQQEPVWVKAIPRLRGLVRGSDRPRFAFAVVSAVMLYCSERWGWGISEQDAVRIWEANADEMNDGATPVGALDAGMARLIRRNALRKRDEWWLEGRSLVMVRQNLVDALAEGCREMFTAYSFSRQWIERTLRDAYDARAVVVSSRQMRVGRAQRRCIMFDLERMPATAEAVMSK